MLLPIDARNVSFVLRIETSCLRTVPSSQTQSFDRGSFVEDIAEPESARYTMTLTGVACSFHMITSRDSTWPEGYPSGSRGSRSGEKTGTVHSCPRCKPTSRDCGASSSVISAVGR